MIAEIETAMLTRLESARTLGLLGYPVKTVAVLDGAIADTLTAAAADLLPGFWVTFLDETADGKTLDGEHRLKATFRVVAAAAARRPQGAGAESASYRMAQDARVLLSGQTLGLDIDYLEPLRLVPAAGPAVPGLSVLMLDFATTYIAADAANQPGAAIGTPDGSEGVPRDRSLDEIMAIGAGITDFRTSRAGWGPTFPLSDTVTLET